MRKSILKRAINNSSPALRRAARQLSMSSASMNGGDELSSTCGAANPNETLRGDEREQREAD